MTVERRSQERSVPPRGLAVRCTGAERGFESFNFASSILDLSPRGICLLTVGRMRRGAPVTVELFIPEGGSRYRSRGVVAWSTTVENRGRSADIAGIRLEKEFPVVVRKKDPSPPTPRLHPRGPDPQRKHPRFSPPGADLVCYPRGLLRSIGLGKNAARALKDLSRGGVQMVSARKLSPGERVRLRIDFKQDSTAIEAEGVIRWCRRDTASLEPRYYSGVAFATFTPGSESCLEAAERASLGDPTP